VKLRLEQVRIEIAPASLRPQLMAMELQARLEEAEQLALRGDWAGVGRAAALVDRAAAQVAAAGLDEGAPALSGVQRHTEVLTRIAADAPQSAREGLQRAIDASTAAATGDHGSAGNGNANGSGNGNANGAGNGSASHAPDPSPGQNNAGGQSADHTPKADPSPGAGRR